MTRTLEEIADEIKRATGAESVSIRDFVEFIPNEPRELQNPPRRLRITATMSSGVKYEATITKDLSDDPHFDHSYYFKRELEQARDRIDGSDPEHVRLLHKARLLLRCVLNEGFTQRGSGDLALRNHVERLDKYIEEYKAARNAGEREHSCGGCDR